ncbi:DUF5327 family protein [Abyssicoccus albus]|uniref:YwdI family protein n=1 Tax=Abyssicoccus albus TaxID=1817405 RepID=A0A3N5BYF3_9BACL|nr:DUF5327 family protein [Abyssicoccus albus]RPF54838.1 hypothetical protein EDD62_1618 [Abyssicoccus albus]
MDKEQLLFKIEHELNKAYEASTNEEFKKYMYAIHILSDLDNGLNESFKSATKHDKIKSDLSSKQLTHNEHNQQEQILSKEETLKRMGASMNTTSQPSSHSNVTSSMDNIMQTEDGVGNGGSLFDF